jgi:L,D-transpeptidase YcbB
MAHMCVPWRKIGSGRQKPSPFVQPQLSRRTAIAGGTLSALCALAGCGTVPQPEAASIQAPPADTELQTRMDDAPNLVVAGEPLNAALLQRFYARRGFQPVWTTNHVQAASLASAVMRAGDQGLNPDLFHVSLLEHGTALSPLDRELVLTDAFLSYADALARGAVPVERRGDDEVLTPEPIDVTAVLDTALDSPDPGAVIEALAPTTPTYRALRQALQKLRSGAPAGGNASPAGGKASLAGGKASLAGGKASLAGGKASPAAGKASRNRLRTIEVTTNSLRTIEVNLERQRWLPRSLPADRAWVNVADERLVLYRADQPVFSTRVVVGEDVKIDQSPEFHATIDASFYNPPWVIPKDIVTAEILPKISRNPNYLTQNNMIMLAGGEAEQLPGPGAGLGLIMFDMPNKFDVYLHDTPDRYIFSRENRRLSHGCIRVQDPREFAALLMQEPIDAINQGIAMGSTTRNDLPTPVPVFVVYQTAFVDTDGTLQFRPDFYDRDAVIWQQLHRRPGGRDPTAQADRRPGPSGIPTL